jgi:hypothetical protein
VVRYVALHCVVAHCVGALEHYAELRFFVELHFFVAELQLLKVEHYVAVARKSAWRMAIHFFVPAVRVPISPDCALVYHPNQSCRVPQPALVDHHRSTPAAVPDATHRHLNCYPDYEHLNQMNHVGYVLVELQLRLDESQFRPQ